MAPAMTLTHAFFDIGGVLGTNGWDHEQRARAAEQFGLDEEFEHRHHEIVGDWERGDLSTGEYLESTIFYRPRDYSPDEVVAFMREQSRPDPECIGVVRELRKRRPGLVLMTLNNESEDLNRYRIQTFELEPLFSAFLSSCWLGARKPSLQIFHRALGIAGASPAEVLFVDDREQNLAPARSLGMQTIHFRGAESLRDVMGDMSLL